MTRRHTHAALDAMLRREARMAWENEPRPGAGLGLALTASVLGFCIVGLIGLAACPMAATALATLF